MKHYEWKLGESLGEIRLDMTEAEVKKVLGTPDEIEKEQHREDEGLIDVKSWYYAEIELMISFHYLDGQYLGMIIFAQRFDYGGKNLFDLSKEEVLEMLGEASAKANVEFDIEIDNEDNAEIYHFSNLDLICWFENEQLTEIGISNI